MQYMYFFNNIKSNYIDFLLSLLIFLKIKIIKKITKWIKVK